MQRIRADNVRCPRGRVWSPASVSSVVGLLFHKPRATIIINSDDTSEIEAYEAWREHWRSSLTRLSENYGCGCCVLIYDVEGSEEAIDAIADVSRSESD